MEISKINKYSMDFVYDFRRYVESINEGFIKTYDIKKTVSDLDNLLNRNNLIHKLKITDNTFILLLKNFNAIHYLDSVLDIILVNSFNVYGWFACNMKLVYLSGKITDMKFNKNYLLLNNEFLEKVYIKFESKFDVVVDNIPDKLYHLSIQQYEKNIIKSRLTTKGKSKLSTHDYDGRIYVCDSLQTCFSLIPNMNNFYEREKYDILIDDRNTNKKYTKNTKWVIFEIDTKLAGINKLYKDPNCLGGYYYLNIIKSDSIKVIDKEK